jgi:protein-disulfide isomerase
VQRQLGDRLRLVFRHFPITAAHPHAQHAAEVSEAAAAQGEFWGMHDMLYEHQDRLDDSSLLEYAASLHLDVSRVERELAEHVYRSHIREQFQAGARTGVNGTPTFFLNGVRYDGDWTDEPAFAAALSGS